MADFSPRGMETPRSGRGSSSSSSSSSAHGSKSATPVRQRTTSSVADRRTPLQIAPVPGLGKKNVKRKPYPASASPPPLPQNFLDEDEEDYDQTNGPLSHYMPKPLYFGQGGRQQGSYSGSESQDDEDNDDEETAKRIEMDLENQIGSYTAPTVDGLVFSQTPAARVGLPLGEHLRDAKRNLEGRVQDLHNLLDEWDVDQEHRDKLLKNVGRTFGIDMSLGIKSRIASLRLLRDNLEAAFKATGVRYGPKWVKKTLEQENKVMQNPYLMFSQLVAMKAKFNEAVQYVLHSAELTYIPYLRQSIKDRGDVMSTLEKQVSVLEKANKEARENMTSFQKVRDYLLEHSFPNTGLPIETVIDEIKAYYTNVNKALTETYKQGRDTFQRIFPVIEMHSTAVPPAGILQRVFSDIVPPWPMKDGKGGREMRPADVPSIFFTNFERKYVDNLQQAGVYPSDTLRALLDESFTIIKRGTLAVANEDEEKKVGTGLAVTGDFLDFIKSDLVGRLEFRNNRSLYLDPLFSEMKNPKTLTQILSPIDGKYWDNENARILLSPFDPGSFSKSSGTGDIKQIDTKVSDQAAV